MFTEIYSTSVSPAPTASHHIYGHSAAGTVHLIHAKDASGFPAYYFVQVHPLRFPQLKQALKKGEALNLEKFGHIIASGYGEDAPDNLKEYAKSYFGWKE